MACCLFPGPYSFLIWSDLLVFSTVVPVVRREVYPRIYQFPRDVFKVKSLSTCWICVVCFIHLNWNWTCFITRETLLKSVAVTQGDVVTQWQHVSSSWCSRRPCCYRKLVLTDICTLCNSCVNRHTARIVSWGEVFCEQLVMQQNCGVTRLITLISFKSCDILTRIERKRAKCDNG